MEPLKPMTKGEGPEGTIYDTEYANQIVAIVNAVIKARVSPDGMGRFHIAKDQMILELPPKNLFFGIANGELACWEQPAKDVDVPPL